MEIHANKDFYSKVKPKVLFCSVCFLSTDRFIYFVLLISTFFSILKLMPIRLNYFCILKVHACLYNLFSWWVLLAPPRCYSVNNLNVEIVALNLCCSICHSFNNVFFFLEMPLQWRVINTITVWICFCWDEHKSLLKSSMKGCNDDCTLF